MVGWPGRCPGWEFLESWKATEENGAGGNRSDALTGDELGSHHLLLKPLLGQGSALQGAESSSHGGTVVDTVQSPLGSCTLGLTLEKHTWIHAKSSLQFKRLPGVSGSQSEIYSSFYFLENETLHNRRVLPRDHSGMFTLNLHWLLIRGVAYAKQGKFCDRT